MGECCVCLDAFDEFGFECMRCKDGLVCVECFRGLEQVKCPVCRMVVMEMELDVKLPDVVLESPRRRRRSCRCKCRQCCLSFGWTILLGTMFQFVFGIYREDMVLNIFIILSLGVMMMSLVHCSILLYHDELYVLPYMCCEC